MSAKTPEDVHRLFASHFSHADLDALVALYEEDAVLLPQPGVEARGHAAIREALAGFLALHGRFALQPDKVAQAGDLAILFADWTLQASDPDGHPLHLAGRTADVVRRQADGSWLLVIDNPFGAG